MPNCSRFQRATIIMLAVALMQLTAGAADPGSNDPEFQQRGFIDGPIYGVDSNPQGDIFIVGTFNTVYGSNSVHLAVLAPDGSLRAGIGSEQHLDDLGNALLAVAADPYGGVFVGGPYGMKHLVKVTANFWRSDDAFQISPTGSTVRNVHSIAIAAPTLWIAGDISWTGGSPDNPQSKSFQMIKMGTGGELDLGFTSPSHYVSQIRYQAAAGSINESTPEHLLVAGFFGLGAMSPSGANLQLVQPFVTMSCVAERSGVARIDCNSGHGEIIGAGEAYPNPNTPGYLQSSGMKLRRFNSQSEDTSFRAIPYAADLFSDIGYYISAVEALPGGDLLVAGLFSRIDNAPAQNFAHLLPDGRVDKYFVNNTGVGAVACMARQADGKFLLAGLTGYSPFGGSIQRRLAMPNPVETRITTEPVDLTLYVGDDACLNAEVVGTPAPTLGWYQQRTGFSPEIGTYTYYEDVPNQQYSSLYFYGLDPTNSGIYRLFATNFCNSVSSRGVHLTVLPAPAAPPNDHFADAINLTGLVVATNGTMRGATLEPGEADHAEASDGRSVWWNWTAPADGIATIDWSGSDFTPACAVYSGDALADLSKLATTCDLQCHSNGEGGQQCFCDGQNPTVTFQATVGTVYRIAVGGTPPAGSLGQVVLRINPIVFTAQSLKRNDDGSFHFDLGGTDGTTVVVECTPSLTPANWQPIATNIVSGGTVSFTDAATNTAAYYRAKAL
jgi:hypothetical protein